MTTTLERQQYRCPRCLTWTHEFEKPQYWDWLSDDILQMTCQKCGHKSAWNMAIAPVPILVNGQMANAEPESSAEPRH